MTWFSQSSTLDPVGFKATPQQSNSVLERCVSINPCRRFAPNIRGKMSRMSSPNRIELGSQTTSSLHRAFQIITRSTCEKNMFVEDKDKAIHLCFQYPSTVPPFVSQHQWTFYPVSVALQGCQKGSKGFARIIEQISKSMWFECLPVHLDCSNNCLFVTLPSNRRGPSHQTRLLLCGLYLRPLLTVMGVAAAAAAIKDEQRQQRHVHVSIPEDAYEATQRLCERWESERWYKSINVKQCPCR